MCRILEGCGSSQHQGQQDFMECQDPPDFNVFSFKKKLLWVPASHCEDACRESKEWYCQQKLDCSMWHGVDFGVAMFIAIAWMCP